MLRIIVVEPRELPYEQQIDGELESMQAIVGGYIECVQLGRGFTLVCNEEGKLQDLKPNRIVGGDVIVGTFFLTKTDYNNGEFINLSDDETEFLIDDFSKPNITGR